MAQVIEFYIPTRFKPKVKWVPPEQRGKILAFPTDLKKSAYEITRRPAALLRAGCSCV
jgi:hypothetical protein